MALVTNSFCVKSILKKINTTKQFFITINNDFLSIFSDHFLMPVILANTFFNLFFVVEKAAIFSESADGIPLYEGDDNPYRDKVMWFWRELTMAHTLSP